MKSVAVRHFNKLLSLLLCAVFLVLLSVSVWAQIPLRCQLEIRYSYEELPISDAAFHIYRVADLNSDRRLTYVEGFSDLQLNMKELLDGADLLYSCVQEQNLPPEQILVTDSHGAASALNLHPGVFLLVGEPTVMDGYVYYVDQQVIFLQEDSLTLHPKSTRLPEQTRLISLKVVKVWDDPGYEDKRPREITVQLLKDSEVFSTVTLSNANGWSYTWNDLLPNARWTVQEDVPKGYKLTIQQSDGVFTLTNQYKDIPQTGQIWWPVVTALLVGVVLVAVGLFLRRQDCYEG